MSEEKAFYKERDQHQHTRRFFLLHFNGHVIEVAQFADSSIQMNMRSGDGILIRHSMTCSFANYESFEEYIKKQTANYRIEWLS